jgi:hypothetical protein
LLNGRFQLEGLGEVSVKGKSHAIVTFRVTGPPVEQVDA